MKTVYESIRAQKASGMWGDNLTLFDRASKLERDYRIYKGMLELEPSRSYGYIQRLCNTLKISKLGGVLGIGRKYGQEGDS